MPCRRGALLTLPEGQAGGGYHQQGGPCTAKVGAQGLEEGEHCGAAPQPLLVGQHSVVALTPLAAQPVDSLGGGEKGG